MGDWHMADARRWTGDASEHGAEGERRNDSRVGGVDLTRWRTPVGRTVARAGEAVARRTGPYAALGLTLAIGIVLAIALSAVAIEVYDAVTDADGVAGVDQPLLDAIIAVRTPAADALVTAFTDLAGTVGMPAIAILAILILALRRRSWTPVVLIVAAGAGSLAMTVLGKAITGRDRPPLADAVPPYELSASFPSGHTLNAVAILGIIAYLVILRRSSRVARVAIAVGAAVLAALVAASRVYLGHHWLTDVIAGYALGAAWLALVITAHRVYLTVRQRREERAEA